MHKKKCPICGEGILKKDTTEETFEYKGKSISIPNYVTYKCNVCKESIVDNKILKESGRILKDFQREIDGFLPGHEIKRIRQKLGLTQERMAEILGGGLKGFARYESGQICQSKAMDNLLRILDKYPDFINVIAPSYGIEYKNVINIENRREQKQYKMMDEEYKIDKGDLAYGT